MPLSAVRYCSYRVDERLVELLGALRVEPLHQGDHGRRRFGEQLPDLLARIRLEPQRPVLELELELLAEHVLDVILATPFVRLATVDRLVREAAVELAELRVRLPGGEPEARAGAGDTPELGGDVRMVGSEDQAEVREDGVERSVVVREVLDVAEIERDVGARGVGYLARLDEHRLRGVDAGHVRAAGRRADCDVAAAAREVEHPVS